MVFSTPLFLFLFLPVCLILYFMMPGIRAKNITLMLMSLIFYAWGEPVWVLLMLFGVFVNYAAGIGIEKTESSGKKKALLVAAVAVNLGFIAVFKYAGLFISTLNEIPGVNIPAWNLHNPIGISFFTFQALSYTIDVYWKKVDAQRSYFDLLLYVSLFPQLIAGPIVRYVDVAREIVSRKVTASGFAEGATRFLAGLAKKLLLGDYCEKTATLLLSGAGDGSVLGGWFGLVFFALHIYFDFSGYSDMAIGLGKMFGFHFKENFNYPYIARSVTDFWRRWHISLSSFFRDYLYIPLGGNRKHQVFNLLVVWFLTGLWHGASWNFVLWGLYFGILLILEKFVFKNVIKKMPPWLGITATLVLVLFGWALFYFTDFALLGAFVSRIFGFSGAAFASASLMTILENNLLLLAVSVVACTPVKNIVRSVYNAMCREGGSMLNLAKASNLVYNTGLLTLCVAAMVLNDYKAFMYFIF